MSLEGLRLSAREGKSYSKGYLSNVELGLVARPSDDLLLFYAKHLNGDIRALVHLRDQLPAPAPALKKVSVQPAQAFDVASRVKRHVIVARRWREASTATVYRCNEPGAKATVTFRIRNRIESDVSKFGFAHVMGATVDRTLDLGSGLLQVDLGLDFTGMTRGDLLSVAYWMTVGSTEVMKANMAYYIHEAVAGPQWLEIEFKDCAVSRAWWFRDEPSTSATVPPDNADHDLPVGKVVRARFSELAIKETYGICWTWSDEVAHVE